jgi:phosphoribosylanthranilate isomerase
MTAVKICGVTTVDDALQAVWAGADMMGLNFYEPSPRYVPVEQAGRIVDALRQNREFECPVLVGLFVNAAVDEVRRTMEVVGLDFAQLSGDEAPEDVEALQGRAFKSIRPRTLEEASKLSRVYGAYGPEWDQAPSIVVDAYHAGLYGGTGERAGREIALAAREAVPRLMLAGGLTPDNVAEAVQMVRPWGVDVASGVEDRSGRSESRRRKNSELMKQFVRAVRQVDVPR